ncbi:unnamed protein product [Gordionus sp. m RMFG-2023]
MWDFTCIDPIASSNNSHDPLNRAESLKNIKYSHLMDDNHFVPIAATSTCSFGQAALDLFKIIFKSIKKSYLSPFYKLKQKIAL